MKNKKILIELFKSVYRIRKTEEKISDYYKKQEMRCPVHLSIGQEAVATGVCKALNTSDKIVSTHRAHAHYLAKGGNLKSMISEIHGKKTGCINGLGGSMYLQDIKAGVAAAVPIVGSNIPIGTGIAYKSLFHNSKKRYVTVIFFGEGATEEGVFSESINFAAIHNIPILFVCENNLYSVYTSLKDRQSNKKNLIKIVKNYGVESYSFDGNDVSKVYFKTKKLVNKIKKYSKPIFVEFKTYRWREHCGPNWDDHLGYRPKGELKKWIKKCPLKLIEKKFSHNNYKSLNKIKKNIDVEIEKAFSFARKSPFPSTNLINKLYREIS